ncbi:MAG: gliding motility lipoprotein GldD [Draconibacterium sp.]|nr:gliding motility lipoprotein GldD [Draconibacterium sp.]
MRQIFILLVFIIFIIGCKEKYTPKPRAFFRIEFPKKKYHALNENNFPYNFDIPNYSKISADKHNSNQPFWINISVPKNSAEIHISYFNIKNDDTPELVLLAKLMEETRRLAYKHSIKADAIQEQVFINLAENVFGTIYRIDGNAASPLQFFLTDSTNHFLRGAFYIREVPKIDSLQPVIDFFEPDIIRLIETTTWN